MARINRNYTLMEGTTSTNCSGKLELRLRIDPDIKNNKSVVQADLYFLVENHNTFEEVNGNRSRIVVAGNGGIFPFRQVREDVTYYRQQTNPETGQRDGDFIVPVTEDYESPSSFNNNNFLSTDYGVTVDPEKTSEAHIFYTFFEVSHELDGTCRLKANNIFLGFYDDYNDDATTNLTTKIYGEFFIDLPPIEKAVIPIMADNFTDESDPSFSYEVVVSKGNAYYLNRNYDLLCTGSPETIISFQAALSFDGETIDIPYRDIPIDGTAYVFNLTEAEREVLRQKAQGSPTVPIYYMTKIVREVFNHSEYTLDGKTEYRETKEFISKAQRNFTVVGCNPQLNPTVKDIKPETLALTGDENTFVRYESMAEYAINATPSKHATIISQSVQCGSKTILNLPNGIIDDTESGTFIFNVTDSRGMGASSSVFKNLVEYVKPTCYQKLTMEMSGEYDTRVKVAINGNYFNGSFGAANNELKLEVRYTQNDGSMGDWVTITDTPTFNGIAYSVETVIEGFSYSKAYTFQCRATDKLNVVESAQYALRIYPVFDWGENDFNFNVPVNINADDLSMYNETIIRHSETTNNTVLSASGGHIYVRPGGTDNTYGETIFYPNGNVKFNGTVTFADGTTGGGAADPTDSFADYVIEIGEEAMGSNGTWYWRKWNSGKSEAWGCRNFGNMAVSTAWGNLYRSAVFTQDLPEDVFIRTPDAININFVHTNAGGWISKYDNTAPSAVTTGSFVVIRPVSGNITPTNIGFHIIGEWY